MKCASNAVYCSCLDPSRIVFFQYNPSEKLGLYGCECDVQCATRATHLSDLSLAFLLKPKRSGYMHFGAIVFKVIIINRYI